MLHKDLIGISITLSRRTGMTKLKKILAWAAVPAALTALSLLTVSAEEGDSTSVQHGAAEGTAVTSITESAESSAVTVKTEAAVTAVSDTGIYKVIITDKQTTSPVIEPEVTVTLTEAGSAPAVTSLTETTAAAASSKTYVSKVEPDESMPQGWNLINDRWYYKKENRFLTGIKKIEDEYYCFAPGGALKTGWQTVKGLRKYFDNETHSPVYGWIEYMGNDYYVDAEKGKVTDKYTIDGKEHIFSSAGIHQSGFVNYNGKLYYCTRENGITLPASETGLTQISGSSYYIRHDGTIKTGWQTVGGIRRYFDPITGASVYGWLRYMDSLYYIDELYGKFTGVNYIEDRPYRFDECGRLMTGMQVFDTTNGKICVYCTNSGDLIYDMLLLIDDGRYYFDKNGYAVTGWHKHSSGNTYYFDPETYRAVTGKQIIDGNEYLFSDSGIMTKGFIIKGNKKYYYDESGKKIYGWLRYSSDSYYLDPKTGAAVKGWNTIDGKKYYFDGSNAMAKSFYVIDNCTYYFGTDGALRTGWQTINGDRYYFDSDGKMFNCRHNIDGKDYLFSYKGKLITTGNQKMPLTALTQVGQQGGQPYWGEYWGSPWRFEWCACFVSWTAAQCGYVASGAVPEFISCKVGIEWFMEHGVWKGLNYTPVSGDIIFFDWDLDGAADHTGIVDYCDENIVYTIEGNSDDAVKQQSYYTDYKYIFGYASPKY